MIRRMNPSKRGTVNPVSPWAGLQTIPFEISLLRTGAIEVTVRPSSLAISPERCGPAPNSAIARRNGVHCGFAYTKVRRFIEKR